MANQEGDLVPWIRKIMKHLDLSEENCRLLIRFLAWLIIREELGAERAVRLIGQWEERPPTPPEG